MKAMTRAFLAFLCLLVACQSPSSNDCAQVERVVDLAVNRALHPDAGRHFGSFTYSPPSFSQTSEISNSKTINGNLATVNVPIFGFTGVVRVVKLWGIVTTTLGANHTAPLFRLNDQTAQVAITAAGAALNAAPVGTLIAKSALAATGTKLGVASVGVVVEPGLAEVVVWSEMIVIQKNGAATNIEYQYITTDAPTSGVIQFFMEYDPISANGAVAAL